MTSAYWGLLLDHCEFYDKEHKLCPYVPRSVGSRGMADLAYPVTRRREVRSYALN